ncbi:MAG: acetyltransferase [Planctomycetes bacterium]|nr:acetyltransferase [Planctomycetota bacterium]
MSLDVFMDDGVSMPEARAWRQRLWLRWGRYLATRHAGVSLDATCRVHPSARIHPRGGRLEIGARSTVAAGAVVQGQVRIGADSSVQTGSILVAYGEQGAISIGDGVRIAPQVMLIAANHIFASVDIPIHRQGLEPAPITIEDDVWLAGKVMVTAGVRIGRGCVVGAGAVVTKDLPPWSVAIGVPARVVRSRRPSDAPEDQGA